MSQTQIEKLTHIIYSFATINPAADGTLNALGTGEQALLDDMVSQAHANGKKAIIAIGGWYPCNYGNRMSAGCNGDEQASPGIWATLVSDPVKKAAFVDNMYNFCVNNNMDGIDIDWEYPNATDQQLYVDLLAALRIKMDTHPTHLELSTAVPANDIRGQYFLSTMIPHLDDIHIMAYDNDPRTNHSSYDFAVGGVNYWIGKGAPASKLQMGLPFYGWGPSGASHYKALVATHGAAAADQADPGNANSSLINGISYNSKPVIEKKTQYVLDNNIGGVMIWALNHDALPSTGHSLLSTIQTTIDNHTGGGTTTHNITASTGANGTISPNGVTSVTEGNNQTYTITASSGYEVDYVNVDGTSQGAVTSYTFTNVTTTHTIDAFFKATSGGGGSCSYTAWDANTIYDIAYDDTISYNGNYYVNKWWSQNNVPGVDAVWDNLGTCSGGGTTTYTLTATTGANGTISPSGVTTVNEASSQAYTITASSGYEVDYVNVDGVSQGAITSHTFTNVTASHTIDAFFRAIPATTYTITATAGANGSISPAGTVTVANGGTQSYTITPNSGYEVDDVTVGGISQGAITSYTFSNVSVNHTIDVFFIAIPSGGGNCTGVDTWSTGYSPYNVSEQKVYNGRLYECTNTAGVYCNTITPTDAGWGSTAWTDLGVCSSSRLDNSIDHHLTKTHLILFPNPAKDIVSIEIGLVKAGNLHVEILDMKGQKVKEITNGWVIAGGIDYDVHIDDLTSGTYLVKIHTDDEIIVEKLHVK